MILDHAAIAVIEKNQYFSLPLGQELDTAMRLLGRMAFPLYAFFLVQGFLYTKDRKKYGIRLALLAFLSEIPYDLMVSGKLFYMEEQNTVFTLLLGLGALACMETAWKRGRTGIMALFGCLGLTAAAQILHADYGAFGILFILSLFLLRNRFPERMFFGCLILFADYKNIMGIAAWIAFFFINRYNGEKGKSQGWLPYIFYPAHILILYILGEILYVQHF